ncbi:MAG: hypothetical protein DBX55_07775 [Verrucomicrobia bacterium]|nr:MAG: hypothetical protein DBX55_07775 [Verrucomicrobiota bacterium]
MGRLRFFGGAFFIFAPVFIFGIVFRQAFANARKIESRAEKSAACAKANCARKRPKIGVFRRVPPIHF